MDTEDKQSHKSKLIWLVFLGIIIGLGAIGGFVIWPQLSLKTPADVIIVKAVDGPIKVKPLDPGGATVAHQDLLVIDMLKNGVVNTDELETLRPVLSSPEPPPIDGGKPENATDQASLQTGNMATADKVPAPASEAGNASTPSVTTPKADAAKPKPKPEKTIAQAPTKQGDGPAFVIQLAAFRSAEKAEEIANLLSEKHSSRLESIKLQTMRLDTGANGIFFRVVSPPLPRLVAETACAKLRRAGQDCFLRKFTAPDG
jgi:hypothetical protein